jgi:hypothetical protein
MNTLQWSVAAITAAFVAVVSFLQWRTAKQKAVLDLFDKRFKIYETVKNCGDQVGRNPQYFSEREKEFLKAVNEAYLALPSGLRSTNRMAGRGFDCASGRHAESIVLNRWCRSIGACEPVAQ